MTTTRSVLASLALLAGCGGSATDSAPDAAANATDGDSRTVTLPVWMLEDIQPQSPRSGQTYGLQTFAGKIVVVTLSEGF
jgi:hypothetical protein